MTVSNLGAKYCSVKIQLTSWYIYDCGPHQPHFTGNSSVTKPNPQFVKILTNRQDHEIQTPILNPTCSFSSILKHVIVFTSPIGLLLWLLHCSWIIGPGLQHPHSSTIGWNNTTAQKTVYTEIYLIASVTFTGLYCCVLHFVVGMKQNTGRVYTLNAFCLQYFIILQNKTSKWMNTKYNQRKTRRTIAIPLTVKSLPTHSKLKQNLMFLLG